MDINNDYDLTKVIRSITLFSLVTVVTLKDVVSLA